MRNIRSSPQGPHGQVLRAREAPGHRARRGLRPLRHREGEAERRRQGARARRGRRLGAGPLLQVQAQGDADRDEVRGGTDRQRYPGIKPLFHKEGFHFPVSAISFRSQALRNSIYSGMGTLGRERKE